MQFLSFNVEDLLRGLWASICQFLYWLIAWLYELFMNISQVRILEDGDIKPIYQRITMILAIIMVFYATFEAVKYVVQPDTFSDKEKGGSKLVLKMIMVVILIAFVPKIFSWSYDLQNAILKNQILEKVILGKETVDTNEAGRYFSANILGMFYYPETEIFSEKELNEEANCDKVSCKGVVNLNIGTLTQYGKLQYMQLGLTDGDEVDSGGSGDVFTYYIHFDGLFAVLVGAFVIYMLVLYCIDAGVRVAQLTFLQIIAPIPIIGYLAPQKDGIFQKWTKQCITTYIDLFIRIAIIYFILLICQILSTAYSDGTLLNNVAELSTTMKVFVYIALIMGLLLFAKKAPDMLKELFPKSGAASGNFGLKAGARVPAIAARGAGMAIGGALAGAKGLIGGTANRIKRNFQNRDSRKENKANYKQSKADHKTARQARRNFNRQARRGQYMIEDRDAKGNVIMRTATKDEIAKKKQELNQDLKDRKIDRDSAKAAHQNTKYRSVLLSAAAGVTGGTARGAVAGAKATDVKGVAKQVSAGLKAENTALAKTEKWYDEGGGSRINRTITGVEKGLGISTSTDRIANTVKRYDNQIKVNETLASAEGDTKAKRDDVENRLASKLESRELKAKITDKERKYLESKVSPDLDIQEGDTVSSLYARYKAKTEEAKSKLDSKIKDGASQEDIDKARMALENAEVVETQLKKHAMRAAYTQMLQDPTSSLNDPVAMQKMETMKLSVQNANRNLDTIRKFESYTQRDKSNEERQILDDMAKKEQKIRESTDLSDSEKAARIADIQKAAKEKIDNLPEKYMRQIKAFKGEIAFEDYDQLDEIITRLQNIADDRTRANMAIKETKRRIEASNATTAAKADNSTSGGK